MAKKIWIGGTSSFLTDANTTTNYSPSGVPTTGDDLYIDAATGTTYSITTSLSALNAVVLNSLNISQAYSAQVGTPAAYFQISASTVNIGYSTPNTSSVNGSPLICLNLGTNSSAITVSNTCKNSAMSSAGPVRLLGSHTTNSLNILSGIVTVAVGPTEAATIQTITNNAGTVTLGSSLTLGNATLNQNGGTTILNSSINTAAMIAGNLTTAGTGAVSTFTIYSGNAVLNSNGTITAMTVFGGSVDFSGDARSKTITNSTIYSGSINFDNKTRGSIVLTNPLAVKGPSGKVKLQFPINSNVSMT